MRLLVPLVVILAAVLCSPGQRATAWKTDLKEVVALSGLLREQVANNPDDYMANLQKADGFRVMVLAERGTGASVNEMPEYWEAVHSYKKAIEVKTDDADLHMIYLSLATLLHRNLQTEEAVHYHKAALAIEPENDNTWMLLGYLYETSGRYEDATAAYTKSLDINPMNLDAHSRLVTLKKYNNISDPMFQKLIAAYENALEHDEDSVDIFDFSLAKAYRDVKDTKRSFYHLAKGNRLTKEKFGYNFQGHFNIAAQMTQLFQPEVWVRCLTPCSHLP